MHRNDFLDLTRDGYDRTAGAYAERFDDYLDDKPVDRAMVDAVAYGHSVSTGPPT